MENQILPPKEEFEGQFQMQELQRSMGIQMNRVFNFVRHFDSTNTTLVIKRSGFAHLIIHPLGEDGETLDIDFNDNWATIYREKMTSRKGIKWLNDNWALPERKVDTEKERVAKLMNP